MSGAQRGEADGMAGLRGGERTPVRWMSGRRMALALVVGAALLGRLSAQQVAAAGPAVAWSRVTADAIELDVRGRHAGVTVVERMAWEPAGDVHAVEDRYTEEAGAIRIIVPRFDGSRDRLLSGFAAVEDGQTGAFAWSPMPGPSSASEPIAWPRSKKGVTCPVDLDDIAALGAAQVAINLQPTAAFLAADAPEPPAEYVREVEGERLRFDPRWVAALDREVGGLTAHGAFVVAIVTVAIPAGADNDHPLVHPRCDLAGSPHRLSAFRVTDRRGVAHFVGFLRFVAERYAQAGAPHGRIGGYVIGNELDAHHEWHGMGAATLDEVVAQHARELRLASLTIRSVHPDLRVFTSLTHAWTEPHRLDPGHALPARALLAGLCAHAETRDLDWHVAFHPYPSNLFEPRFWNDADARFAFDTPKITLRNLEVLVAAMARPEFGGGRRHVLLTEQGFHCPDGPEGEDLQAAAYAFAWRKVERFDGIDGFLLHRHVDHRGEGGLRLGLWSCDPAASFPSQPLRARRIHDVFVAAGTARFADVAAFAWPIVGERALAAPIVQPGPFPDHDPHAHPAMREPGAVDLRAAFADATLADAAAFELRAVSTAEGELRGFLLHPLPGGRPAQATIPIDVASPQRLRFVVAKHGDGGDGVRFFVARDGVELWSAVRTDATPFACEVVLPAGACRLTFGVDARADTSWDHALWLAPRLVAASPR